MEIMLVAFAEEHVALILDSTHAWQDLAPTGPPYWRPRATAEIRRKIQSMSGPQLAPEYNFVVVNDDTPVGECSVHSIDYRNRVAQLGVCIWNPAHRQQGYGAAALREVLAWATGYLNLERLEAWIVDGNAASQRMVERLGFQHEGTLRARYLVAGTRANVHVYGRLGVLAGTGPVDG